MANPNADWNQMLEQVLKGIKNRFPEMNYDTLTELFSTAEIRHIPKRESLIRMGQYDRRIAFVIKGVFRAFYKSDDTEYTIWFREENDLFASHSSIMSGKPSTLTYQAIEDSIVMVMDYDYLKMRAANNHEIARSIIIVLEGLLLRLIESLENYIIMNPEERFMKILENKSALVNRVPQNQLASLLGITPESFSRLKMRIKNKLGLDV